MAGAPGGPGRPRPVGGGQLESPPGQVGAGPLSHFSVGASEASHQNLVWRPTKHPVVVEGGQVSRSSHTQPWQRRRCGTSELALSCDGLSPSPSCAQPVPPPRPRNSHMWSPSRPSPWGRGFPALGLNLSLAKCWCTWPAVREGLSLPACAWPPVSRDVASMYSLPPPPSLSPSPFLPQVQLSCRPHMAAGKQQTSAPHPPWGRGWGRCLPTCTGLSDPRREPQVLRSDPAPLEGTLLGCPHPGRGHRELGQAVALGAEERPWATCRQWRSNGRTARPKVPGGGEQPGRGLANPGSLGKNIVPISQMRKASPECAWPLAPREECYQEC